MSDQAEQKPKIGGIEWHDLTVPNAEEVKDFYSKVVGWKVSAQSMGDYDDYNIQLPESGDTVAGVCHARGVNSSLPAQWLMYVRVEDVEKSIATCLELGGEVLSGPDSMGGSKICVIKDPAGAVLALIS